MLSLAICSRRQEHGVFSLCHRRWPCPFEIVSSTRQGHTVKVFSLPFRLFLFFIEVDIAKIAAPLEKRKKSLPFMKNVLLGDLRSPQLNEPYSWPKKR